MVNAIHVHSRLIALDSGPVHGSLFGNSLSMKLVTCKLPLINIGGEMSTNELLGNLNCKTMETR